MPRKPNGEIPHLNFTPFIKTFGIGVNYYQPVPIFDALEVDGAKMDSSFFVDHDFGHGNATLKSTHMYYFQSQKSGQEHFVEEHLNQSLKWKKINNQMESMINGLAPEEKGLTRLTWFYFTHEIAISPQRFLKRYDEGKTQILGIKYNKFLSVVERNLKLRLGANDLGAGLIVKRPGSAAIKKAALNIIQVLESLPDEDLPLENLQAPQSLLF